MNMMKVWPELSLSTKTVFLHNRNKTLEQWLLTSMEDAIRYLDMDSPGCDKDQCDVCADIQKLREICNAGLQNNRGETTVDNGAR